MNDFQNKRRYIRFEPDGCDYVQIDKNPNSSEFHCDAVALLVEESPMGGCSIVCLQSLGLIKGQVYRVKVGRLAALKAELVWERVLDDKVLRCGLRFLE